MPPAKHVEEIGRLGRSEKALKKGKKGLLKEIALLAAAADAANEARVLIHHREDADNAYLSAYVKALGSREGLIFASCGEREGSFMLTGPPPIVEAVSKEMGELLEAKGGCRGGTFQGKAARIDKRTELMAVLTAALAAAE